MTNVKTGNVQCTHLFLLGLRLGRPLLDLVGLVFVHLGLDEVDVGNATHEEGGSVLLLEAIHLKAKLLVQFRELLEY